MAWGAAAKVAAKTSLKAAGRAALSSASRAATQALAKKAAATAARSAARGAARSMWRTAAKSTGGRIIGRSYGAFNRALGKVAPHMEKAAYAAQIAGAAAPYLEKTLGGRSGDLARGAARELDPGRQYTVGGKTFTRDELLAELQNANKLMQSLQV
jgi:hypothetical protein